MVFNGDILYAMYGATAGNIAITPIDGAINQAILCIRPFDNIDKTFLYYQLEYMKSNILNKYIQGGQGNLSAGQILNLKIKLTSLNNQEKISKLLSLIDDLIEQYSNIEELYILTKKSYMQQLFNENNHDKQLVEIKIKDIAKITSGVGFSEKLQGEINGVVPFFKVSDMNNSGNEKIMTTSNNYVSYNAINNNNFNVIESKSIIFAKVGAAVALERKRICNEKFLIDNNMMAISPNSNVNLEYLYHRLTNFRLMRICQEGALPSIKGSDVGNIKFKFHPISKQEKISKLLSSIDDLIILVRKQQKQYKQLKKYHLNNIFK